jgi:hypothetical protein
MLYLGHFGGGQCPTKWARSKRLTSDTSDHRLQWARINIHW